MSFNSAPNHTQRNNFRNNYNNRGRYNYNYKNRYQRQQDEEIMTEFPPDTPGKRIPLGGDNLIDVEGIDHFYKTVMDQLDQQERMNALIEQGKDPAEVEKIMAMEAKEAEEQEKLAEQGQNPSKELSAEAISAGLTSEKPETEPSTIQKLTAEMQRPLDFIQKERNAHCRLYMHNDTQYVIDYIDFLYAKDLVETPQDKCVVEHVDHIKSVYTTEITINDLFISNNAGNKRDSKLGACEQMRALLEEEYGNLVDFKMMLDGAEGLKVRPKRNPKTNRRKRKNNNNRTTNIDGENVSKKQLNNLGHLDQNVINSGIHDKGNTNAPGTAVMCDYQPISNASMPMAEMRQKQILEARRPGPGPSHKND